MKRYVHYLMQLFLLYTLRNRGTAHAGLGFLDSKSDALSIQLPCEAKRESAHDRPNTRQPRIEVTVYQDVSVLLSDSDNHATLRSRRHRQRRLALECALGRLLPRALLCRHARCTIASLLPPVSRADGA